MPYGKRYDNTGSGKGTYRGSTNEKVAQVDFASQKKYPQALKNPFKLEQDVRIPDGEAMVPTCTFDVNQEFDVVSNAQGFAAICIGLTPKPKVWTSTSAATSTGLATEANWVDQTAGNVAISGTKASDGILLSGTSATEVMDGRVIPTEAFWKTADTNYRGWRLVAAGVNVQFVGNDTNNQGIITGLHVPGGTSGITTSNMEYAHTTQANQIVVAGTNLDAVWAPTESYVEQMADWNGPKFRSVTAGAAKGTVALGTNLTSKQVNIVNGATDPVVGSTYPGLASTHNSVYDLRNCLGSITRPVKDGLNLLYKPRTPSDFKYRRPLCGNVRPGSTALSLFWDHDKLLQADVPVAASTNWGPQNTSGSIWNYLQIDDTGNGCLLIAAHGMSTSPTPLKVRVVMHYEALPESNVNLTDGGKIAWADKAMVSRAAAAHLITETPQPGGR